MRGKETERREGTAKRMVKERKGKQKEGKRGGRDERGFKDDGGEIWKEEKSQIWW